MPDEMKTLPHLEAAVTVRYQIPNSMPPVFRQIAQGTVFPRNVLPETDVVHMLRQKTVLATDKPIGPPPPVEAAADEALPVAD